MVNRDYSGNFELTDIHDAAARGLKPLSATSFSQLNLKGQQRFIQRLPALSEHEKPEQLLFWAHDYVINYHDSEAVLGLVKQIRFFFDHDVNGALKLIDAISRKRDYQSADPEKTPADWTEEILRELFDQLANSFRDIDLEPELKTRLGGIAKRIIMSLPVKSQNRSDTIPEIRECGRN